MSTLPISKRTEIIISNLLRTGVLLSLATIFLGVVLIFAHHHDYLRSKAELAQLTSPGAAFPRTIGEIARGVWEFRGQAVVALGLLMLIMLGVFAPATAWAQSVTVIAPNGGEVWTAGSQQTIEWHYDGDQSFVEIEYGNGVAPWIPIAAIPASNTTYQWTVPNDPGFWYIRICDTWVTPRCDQSDGTCPY